MVRLCMTDAERRRVQPEDVAEAFRPVVVAEMEACAKMDEPPRMVTVVTDAVGVDSAGGVGKVKP